MQHAILPKMHTAKGVGASAPRAYALCIFRKCILPITQTRMHILALQYVTCSMHYVSFSNFHCILHITYCLPVCAVAVCSMQYALGVVFYLSLHIAYYLLLACLCSCSMQYAVCIRCRFLPFIAYCILPIACRSMQLQYAVCSTFWFVFAQFVAHQFVI